MTLSTQDGNTILTHFALNPDVKGLGSDYLAIAEYYASVPTATLTQLMDYMTPLDRYKYFRLERFGNWYSEFNLKLHEATATVVIRDSLEEIIEDSQNLLNGITEAGLTSQTMQELVTDMFRRQLFDCLFSFLVCLASDGVFESMTIWLYSIELSPYPRWITMGLMAPPSESDLVALLGG